MPKTNNTPKQGITPKQNTAPKTNNTPKQGITPKQNTTPKTSNTPKQGITPKQNTAPKTNNTPKQGITPKQNTAPKTSNTPKQNTTPKTPQKPVTNSNPATTPQSKTPTNPAANKQSSSNGSLSIVLTGNYSPSFENHLRGLEKKYGPQYVFEKVFKGDKTKYDPYKRSSQITGKSNIVKNNEINKTSQENISKKEKSEIDLSKGKADRIKCQNDTWNGGNGWSGCYSESIDAMWRINHSDKVSADETHIIKNDMSNGSIDGTESYCYKASININNNSYTGTIYPGVDSKGNNYNAFRITGLSKDNANNIMNYELENGRTFCYRVYNSEALSQGDGHTILCTGRLPDGTYTYSNCATSQKQYQTNKPLSDQYNQKNIMSEAIILR